jgi:hypothetical protein
MQKREPIRIQTGTQGRLMHQAANGEVCHQEAVEFLPDQIRHLILMRIQRNTSNPVKAR